MKKIVMMAAMAAAMAAVAQPLTPGTGVANDHTGNIGGATGVVYAPRTAETGYGYVDGMTVIGFTFLPWAVPNSSWDVTGVRMNLGWGAYRDTAGFDFGVFSANRNADGLFINWCGTYATGDSHGWLNISFIFLIHVSIFFTISWIIFTIITLNSLPDRLLLSS